MTFFFRVDYLFSSWNVANNKQLEGCFMTQDTTLSIYNNHTSVKVNIGLG